MLKPIRFEYKKFNFPCGEMQVQLKDGYAYQPELEFEFEKNEDIIELMLVCDALKRINCPLETLILPYIPFSRQDRVCNAGDSFSLKVFADLLNSLNIRKVHVTDPHSDVATALINNCVVDSQANVFSEILRTIPDTHESWLISPDAGAVKKIYNLAKKVPFLGVVECSKKRNTQTGEITGVAVHADDLQGKTCYIVDDICDGGRTFIEVAKVLKEKNAGKIVLMVTHAFMTRGIGVFDGLIDEIYSRKGKIK